MRDLVLLIAVALFIALLLHIASLAAVALRLPLSDLMKI